MYSGPALPTSPATAAESITETGSTLLYPLFGSWATAYQKLYTQVTITAGGTGSGTGIADASTGTVDLGGSDAYLSGSDRTTYPTMMNIAVAISAQQVNYNVPGVKSLKLDGTVLAEIYAGKITNWNDSAIAALNPGVTLPNLKIVPLHRADSSGDTFLFTTYMNDQDPSVWASSDCRHVGELALGGRGARRDRQQRHGVRLRRDQGLRRLHRHQLPGQDHGGWPRPGDAEERLG